MTGKGFPHSDISGSKHTYSSPKHIGVRPVLHRRLVPRHPPCALPRLTTVGWNETRWFLFRNPVCVSSLRYLVFKERCEQLPAQN